MQKEFFGRCVNFYDLFSVKNDLKNMIIIDNFSSDDAHINVEYAVKILEEIDLGK